MLGKFACHLRRQRTSLKVTVENCKARPLGARCGRALWARGANAPFRARGAGARLRLAKCGRALRARGMRWPTPMNKGWCWADSVDERYDAW